MNMNMNTDIENEFINENKKLNNNEIINNINESSNINKQSNINENENENENETNINDNKSNINITCLNDLTQIQKYEIHKYLNTQNSQYCELAIEEISFEVIKNAFNKLYHNIITDQNLDDKCIESSEIKSPEKLKNIDIAQFPDVYKNNIVIHLSQQQSPYAHRSFDNLPIEIVIQTFKEIYPHEYEIYDNEQQESDKYPHVDYDKLEHTQQLLIKCRAVRQDAYTFRKILPQEAINRIYYEMQQEKIEAEKQKQIEQEKIQQRKMKEATLKEKIPDWYNEDYYIKGININHMKTYLAFFFLYKNRNLPKENSLEQLAVELLNIPALKYYYELDNRRIIKILKNAYDYEPYTPLNIKEWFGICYTWEDL